jgi:hypothetical protein
MARATRVDPDPNLRVQILGEVTLVAGDDSMIVLQGEEARVLIRLAFAPNRRVPISDFSRIWPGEKRDHRDWNGLHGVMSELRRQGLDIPVQADRGYVLRTRPDAIDAESFVLGVQSLPEEPAPHQLDALLAMWNGDPRRLYPEDQRFFDTAFVYRDRLLPYLERLTWDERMARPAIGRFLDLFESDRRLSRLRTRRKRVLIVDDQSAADIEYALAGYDCVTLTSMPAWHEFAKRDDLRFDLAIIDLHLTRRMNDQRGLQICLVLKAASVPILVITAAKPPVGPQQDRMRKYGVVEWYTKGEAEPGEAELLPGIEEVVARLLGDA